MPESIDRRPVRLRRSLHSPRLHAPLLLFALVLARDARAQQATGPRLVAPVPGGAAVRVAADSFSGALGQRARIDVYRDPSVRGARPVVLFANAGGPQVRMMAGYNDWARLVATRGFV